MYHDASGIIFDLLRAYRRCGFCRGAATRIQKSNLLIIGEWPAYCDRCSPGESPNREWEDLPEAELIRAAHKYLDTHEIKT